MNIIVVPDSFKGTLSATRVADIAGEEIKKAIPSANIKKIPVADGGEGTLDCFENITGGKRIAYGAEFSEGQCGVSSLRKYGSD